MSIKSVPESLNHPADGALRRQVASSRRALFAIGAAAVFHVVVGSLDTGRLVLLFPSGHAMLLALGGWILAIVAGAAALEQTRGRSKSGWLACIAGVIGALLIVFAPTVQI